MDRVDTAFAPLAPGENVRHTKADDWRPIMPAPVECPPPDYPTHSRHGTASSAWTYFDAAGRLLSLVCRFDRTDGGKEVLPYCYGERNGHAEWYWKAPQKPRPLYGLDRLAARPDAPVILCEGEKAADAAMGIFRDHVTVTSQGGSKAAKLADWSALAGRHVVIWPDNDEAGRTYAADAAAEMRQVGAASVRVVEIPAGWPDGWDLADALPDGIAADLRGMLDAASETPDAAGPLPLFPSLGAAEPYPVEALGGVLGPAAAAIADLVQAPVAIAAQSVLAAAALAAQAHADVRLPYGQTRPLSLYLVTVAASGDRKTTTDNEALHPVRYREHAMQEEASAENATWKIHHAAWTAEKKKIESNGKLTFDDRKARLTAIGPEPPPPLHPLLTAPDPTIEGLIKMWVNAPAALGIFTAEGGQFTGGHGMSQDNRLKTAAALSEIWDGQPIKRVRALDGVSILRGRRLSMHLLIQPEAAAGFLSDPALRDQGLLSRALVAAPESLAGGRLYRQPAVGIPPAIGKYRARLLSLLGSSWPLEADKRNELAPPALSMTGDATALWRTFFDHVETQIGKSGGCAPIRDFAAKIAEHAARIAGVITVIDEDRPRDIGADAMRGALALADWYLNEALRLHRAARTDPRLIRAQQLLDWLRGRGDGAVSVRDILRLGPGVIRTKAAADDAVSALIEHGWISEISPRPRLVRLSAEGAT